MGEADDGAPWHDPAMEMPERMKLAEGKPLPRRLFAAMAQQDCGQCGYVCETYSAAIAEGKEPRLNLCAPGGKDTLRMLKTLTEEAGARLPPLLPKRLRCPAGPAGRSPRKPGARHLPVAPQAQRRGLGEGDLACRVRSDRERPRLCRRRRLRHRRAERSAPRRCGHRAARRPARCGCRRQAPARGAAHRPRARPGARCALPAHLLCHRRRDPRRRPSASRRARTRTAISTGSTCSAPCTSSAARGSRPRPSSRRSTSCSRGSTRSRPPATPRPAASR